MKAFKFRLQRLLDYRKLKEEKLQNELASIDGDIRNKHKDLVSRQKIRNAYIKELNGRQATGVKGWEANLYSLFLERTGKEIDKQEEQIVRMRRTRSERQKELLMAANDRKIMQKLKSKAWERFKNEAQRAEQKVIDEVATRRYQFPRDI